jgi:polysaccharide deacetylase 2 family uncharacterized protein YibQ
MNASKAASLIKDSFTDRSFGIGLVGVAAVCGALFGWAFVNGDKIVAQKLEGLPTHTVLIEWNTAPLLRPPTTPPAHFPVAAAATGEPADAAPEMEEPPPEHAADMQGETGADTPDIAVVEQAPPQTPLHAESPDEMAATTPLVIEHAADLPPVPYDGLYETTPEGKLPVIRASDGMTPFKAYRRPFNRAAAGSKPIVSIGVFDMGLSDSATEAALRTLPQDISLVMSPYATAPDFWVQQARERGHELWLSLPVEGEDYPLADPGPHTALIGAGERENIAKLDWVMARLPSYVGFVSGPHASFLRSPNDMRPYLGAIYKRGLAFFDGSASPSLIPQTMAQGMNAPYSTIDVWIDSPATREDIEAALEHIEQLAREQGFVAAMIRPYPLSYQMVQDWVKTLPSKGIVLAPLSAQTGT